MVYVDFKYEALKFIFMFCSFRF